MGSPYPTDAQAIYDWLEADDELMALLGRYRLTDGTILPALAVLWPTESMPAGVDVRGVEVVVMRQRSGNPLPWATGEVALNPVWRLTVTQWQPLELSEPQYEAALDRLMALLPGANWSEVSVPGTTTGLAQAVVRWSNPAVVIPAQE